MDIFANPWQKRAFSGGKEYKFHLYHTIVWVVGTIITLGSTFEISDFLYHSCRGADPDSLDTNGNNICHMMVILNKV